jgi:hypothetical protein
MAKQLIPSPELAHALPDKISVDQRLAMWMDLVDTTEKLLLAGLRREVGPEGDLRAAYRQWSAQYRVEHDEANKRVIEKLGKLGV